MFDQVPESVNELSVTVAQKGAVLPLLDPRVEQEILAEWQAAHNKRYLESIARTRPNF